MESSLSTGQDAQIILQLYQLRTEATMRRARQWLISEYWPASASDVIALLQDFGSEHNQYLRQVVSHWEMAAAFVLHGALNGALFVDSTMVENCYILAKFWPFLAEIRAVSPEFLVKTEQLTSRYPVARERLERLIPALEKRRSDRLKAK